MDDWSKTLSSATTVHPLVSKVTKKSKKKLVHTPFFIELYITRLLFFSPPATYAEYCDIPSDATCYHPAPTCPYTSLSDHPNPLHSSHRSSCYAAADAASPRKKRRRKSHVLSLNTQDKKDFFSSGFKVPINNFKAFIYPFFVRFLSSSLRFWRQIH